METPQILLSAVSGVSAVLYSTEGFSGEVFQGFLRDFYRWEVDRGKLNAVTGEPAAEILYDEYRNPLTHASGTQVFGIDRGARRKYIPQRHRLQIDRVAFNTHPGEGAPEERIVELESEPVRPAWLPATLTTDEAIRKLTVESLYWGSGRRCKSCVRMRNGWSEPCASSMIQADSEKRNALVNAPSAAR